MKKTILLMLIAASFMSVSKGNISFDKQKKMEEEIVLQTKEKEQEKPVSTVASVTQNKSMGSTEKKYRDYIIKVAKSKIGTPYVWGGENNSGFDCSGLVYVSFKEMNIELPRRSSDQAGYGKEVNVENVKIGDLIFFNTSGNSISHVGIVESINHNGAINFVHSSTSKGVVISSLDDNYWKARFVKAVRLL